MSDENVFKRWSRRKVDARNGPPAAASDHDSDEAAADPHLLQQTSESAIAALTGDSDVTVFLKKGVANWAKNAALRRVWAMDPAIRDFVGEARDYGYDWNSGEGVPGFGPILASDNATSILETMFSDVGLMDDKLPDFEALGETDQPDQPFEWAPPRLEPDALAAQPAVQAGCEGTQDITAHEPAVSLKTQPAAPLEPEPRRLSAIPEEPKPRRHGSATPVCAAIAGSPCGLDEC